MPTSGRALIDGVDVATEPHEVRRRIGWSGQAPAVDEILSGRQNLVLFGRLNRLGKAEAQRRVPTSCSSASTSATPSRKSVKHYSGGMRRRLDLAVTLILSPAVLFLDEPTTGLDPRGRNEVWSAIRSLVAGGTTVLLTTQYLDEADQLADQIVVIDTGRTIAEGTPDALKAEVGGDRLDVVVDDDADLAPVISIVGRVARCAAGGRRRGTACQRADHRAGRGPDGACSARSPSNASRSPTSASADRRSTTCSCGSPGTRRRRDGDDDEVPLGPPRRLAHRRAGHDRNGCASRS